MGSKKILKEVGNQIEMDQYEERGPYKMGPWTSWMYRSDPKHLVFTLSRYKFVAKLLQGKKTVLELGGGDTFAAPIILQEVDELDVVDFEPIVIDAVEEYHDKETLDKSNFIVADFTQEIKYSKKYDAVISLDAIEHIELSMEHVYLNNIVNALDQKGICIIGTPNKTASEYANPQAAITHINLKDAADMKAIGDKYFENSFLFSMNDEVVHTGFSPMAHYLFLLGVGLKQ
tara:strand:- start:54 stop:746 length:693 start_codon:yes stop_codon:yes gene_type:complete